MGSYLCGQRFCIPHHLPWITALRPPLNAGQSCISYLMRQICSHCVPSILCWYHRVKSPYKEKAASASNVIIVKLSSKSFCIPPCWPLITTLKPPSNPGQLCTCDTFCGHHVFLTLVAYLLYSCLTLFNKVITWNFANMMQTVLQATIHLCQEKLWLFLVSWLIIFHYVHPITQFVQQIPSTKFCNHQWDNALSQYWNASDQLCWMQ